MDMNSNFLRIKELFEKESGLHDLPYEVLQREDEILKLIVANPTDRLYEILENIRGQADLEDAPLVTLEKGKERRNLLNGAEGKLLLRTLSESLNINQYSFKDDFLSRYIKSVFGAEEQITASANHIVYGRRGAGKSTLLLYSLYLRKENNLPCIWIDMQVYTRRSDVSLIADIFCEVLGQLERSSGNLFTDTINDLRKQGITEDEIRRLLPIIRRSLSHAVNNRELFIFLDDFHVLSKTIQPILLDMIYAVARGNRIFIKLSAIETLTKSYDQASNTGLQVPHDAQLIRLDYNLTMPDKATQHIESILDSHATYCGLPSIRKLCSIPDVLSRLTWVSAGVPRDALNFFAQAMTKASQENRKHVTVSNINVVVSEAINTKLKDLDEDATEESHQLQELLEAIKDFCIKDQRLNAFLVEIKTDNDFLSKIRTLVDLRMLHVISEGITVGEAGRKYLGLILDYGFYTGIRAARSVDLFNRQTAKVAYKELRKLPEFKETFD